MKNILTVEDQKCIEWLINVKKKTYSEGENAVSKMKQAEKESVLQSRDRLMKLEAAQKAHRLITEAIFLLESEGMDLTMRKNEYVSADSGLHLAPFEGSLCGLELIKR